jgi:polysaccharide export outer membrane protein
MISFGESKILLAREENMIRKSLFTLFGAILILCSSNAIAAQSTVDVPVTKELMDSARQKVLAQGKNADDYVIGTGDVLSVQVYGEGDMSVEAPTATRGGGGDNRRTGVGGVTVRMDGQISLKHIGDVDAVGFTLNQFADYLKEIFSTVYDDPVVTVVLVQSNSQRYTVMGQVTSPGIFFLDFPIDLVQVVARCGGFTIWANDEITVVRKNAGNDPLFKGNTLKFDYDDFLSGKDVEKNILIKPGDIIIVH